MMTDQPVTIRHKCLIFFQCNGYHCLLHLQALCSYLLLLEAPVVQQIDVGRWHQLRRVFRLCTADIGTVNAPLWGKLKQGTSCQSGGKLMLSCLFQAITYVCSLCQSRMLSSPHPCFALPYPDSVCITRFVRAEMCTDIGAACTVITAIYMPV